VAAIVALRPAAAVVSPDFVTTRVCLTAFAATFAGASGVLQDAGRAAFFIAGDEDFFEAVRFAVPAGDSFVRDATRAAAGFRPGLAIRLTAMDVESPLVAKSSLPNPAFKDRWKPKRLQDDFGSIDPKS
jgi:hypothetical protein